MGRAGAAAASAALLITTAGAPAAVAAPDDEVIWEEGTVLSVADGDTLVADLDSGPGHLGTRRVRTIGVQAPEVAHGSAPAECGSAQAEKRLAAQLPQGSRVQTRSVDVASNDDYAGGRIVRSLYAQDEEGNWYDTSRESVSDGWLMWFPLSATSSNKPEWAHNLEYRVLADDAAAERRGLWSADLCGPSPYRGADLRVWAKYWGTEEVYVENRSGFAVDLSGWTIRDSAISGYRTLPAGTVIPAGQVRMVYRGDMNLNNLPPDNPAFRGDAVYLMDNAGPYKTGNLRAWFPYPCNPDECGDVLQGKVALALDQISDPALVRPSAPGSVTAVATTDGTGRATVTWAEPINLGGPSVTYTVQATPVDGGASIPATTGLTSLSHTVAGLTLGRGYTFSVVAVNGAGSSDAAATPAVAARGLPGAPSAPGVQPRGAAAVVSWQAPPGIAGQPPVRYSVTATPDPTTDPALGARAATCATTGGETSCVVDGLEVDVKYSATVTATLGAQSLVSAATPFTATEAPIGDGSVPGTPADVVVQAGDSRVVISWTAPDQALSGPISGYEVRVLASDAEAPDCQTTGATSCEVTGLPNGSAQQARVTAWVGSQTSPPATSATFTPTAWDQALPPAAGPTAAPPAVPDDQIWVGGEIVRVTNTSAATIRLGGYGLWDAYSANGGRQDEARYLFPADQTLAAGKSLLVHFGPLPGTRPAATSGSEWLWTGSGTFINSDADFVELAHLNKAQVACRTSGAGTCRGTRATAVPSSPVGITARSSATSVTVNWGAPISRGGLAITGYTAAAYDAAIGGNRIAGCSAGGAARSCSFAGALGRPYFVEVVARNAQGASGPSWRVRAVPKTIPGAPGTVSASGTPGGLNVSWAPAAANGAPVHRYTAAAYTSATGGSPVGTCSTSNGTMTRCTIMGLSGGTYYIDVTARNRAGAGAPSTPRVAVAADAGTAMSTYAKRRVTVRWDAPADAAAAAITGYTARVYTKKSGGSYLGGCTAAAGATECRTKKLKSKKRYYIDLTVVTSAGSYTLKPRIVTGKPRKASRPVVTGATPSGRQVVITWRPPSSTGYTYLKSYQAKLYSKKRGGSTKARCTTSATVTTCTTKSMKKRTYYAAVKVKNSKGWSKWSKRVKVVVR